uniref:Uncharacterized protein n=1 Tax=Xenopus tropicalis TaxID=8364 RepID=A0A1B8Y4U8_XENTR
MGRVPFMNAVDVFSNIEGVCQVGLWYCTCNPVSVCTTESGCVVSRVKPLVQVLRRSEEQVAAIS